MTSEERAELRALCERVTPGPWAIWEGPQYVGGAADLCIGAGEEWLANMDHRRTRCQQIGADGHFEESCDICTIDSGRITDEQRANAEFIAAARTALPRLLDALEQRDRLLALAYDFVNGEFSDQELAEEIAALFPDSRAAPPEQCRPEVGA